MTISIPKGATLTSLAKQYGTTVDQLLRLNPQITNPDRIMAGASLNIPTTTQSANPYAPGYVAPAPYTKSQPLQSAPGYIGPVFNLTNPYQTTQSTIPTGYMQSTIANPGQMAVAPTQQITPQNPTVQATITEPQQPTSTPEVPVQYPDEFQKYLNEAQAYYEPAKVAEMSELEQQVNLEKQRLAEDWQTYLNDINTGKLRTGTDLETQTRRTLEQKTQWIQQQEFNVKGNLDTLKRQWIARGGYFSGNRLMAQQQYLTKEQMAQEQYLGGVNYNLAQYQEQNKRAMEDYATAQQKGETAYTRGVEDVALQRLKDIRSLQEKYNQAIAGYAGQNAYYDTRKFVYGY